MAQVTVRSFRTWASLQAAGLRLMFDATRVTMGAASSSSKAWAYTDNLLSDLLRFIATCPGCKDMRFQQGYSFRTLVTLLVSDQPIVAHCAVCNEFWPITANERAELALLLVTD